MKISELITRLRKIQDNYGPNVDVRVKRITRASLEELKNIGINEVSALHFNIDIEPALGELTAFDFGPGPEALAFHEEEYKAKNTADIVTLTIT